MPIPGRFLICLIAATAGLMLTAAVSDKRKPQPGYACKIEHRGDFGLIEANFQIMDSGGVPSAYVSWTATYTGVDNARISAAFFRRKDGGYSLDNGYVSIQRHIWERRPGKRPRPLSLSLELTANPVRIFGSSRLAGKIERSGGPFYLQLDWLDTAALARGSTNLYLVARNRRGDLVDKVEIDRTAFSRAEPRILAALAEIERMTLNPKEFCTHSDDLGIDDIVIT